MSLSGNASLTLGILPDAWQEAKTHIPVNLNFGLVQLLIGLPLIPVLIVLVNVLWQFVRLILGILQSDVDGLIGR